MIDKYGEFLDDVIEIAKYGCSYWASGEIVNGVQYIWESEYAYPEDKNPVKLDRALIEKGIQKVINDDEFVVNSQIRQWIYIANFENDACTIDSDCADVIVQAAIFGEIIYA